jgi:anti-sigma regulatory factor (Ser/Thr protein kinase)
MAAEFAARAGASAAQRQAIRLAVSEAFTNAVVHGYRRAEGDVSLTLGVAGDELWVIVADSGCGHQMPSDAPGLGWGLALIADATNGFDVAERAGGGTEIRMRFHLDAPVPSPSEPATIRHPFERRTGLGRTRDYA